MIHFCLRAFSCTVFSKPVQPISLPCYPSAFTFVKPIHFIGHDKISKFSSFCTSGSVLGNRLACVFVGETARLQYDNTFCMALILAVDTQTNDTCKNDSDMHKNVLTS